MNLKAFGVEVFAVVASYLILSLPTALGTTVRIYDGSGYVTSTTYNPYYMLKKDVAINPPWDSPSVDISITNSSAGSPVEAVVVYRCRGLGPSACVAAVQPDSSEGAFSSNLQWTAIADQTTSYPQRANLLILGRIRKDGKAFWTGYWLEIERSSQEGFDITDSSLYSMEIYVNTEFINTVREFITKNHMIPFNPLWVTRIIFSSASSMDVLEFDQPEYIDGQEVSGDEIDYVSNNYTLVLPEASGMKNPLVVFNSPSFVCGNSLCEQAQGESSANCCLDCGCSSGYYCDASGSCRPESSIRLSMYGSMQAGISNCFESHVLTAPVQVVGAPTGMDIVSAWYRLRSDQYNTSCTRLSGSIYSCQVTVPAMPDCTEGVFVLGPNLIGVRISYMDGADFVSRDLQTALPNINIGSFTCGEGGCEVGLGEGSSSCCYDCGCPSGYCDYDAGITAAEAVCRQGPDSDDVYLAGMDPTHFTGLSGTSGMVTIEPVIGNAPRSIVVTDVSCSLGCMKGTETCSSSCSISCSEAPGTSGEHRLSCQLMFSIDDYDVEADYILSPDIEFSLSYRNGTLGMVSNSISKSFSQISIGSKWCGNSECVGDEGPLNCCYDCGCPSGEYCDTRNINGPTQGDGCKPLSGAGLVTDSVGDLSLEDSTKEHIIKIKGHITDPPSGFSVSGKCDVADDPMIECVMYCQGTEMTSSGYGVECDMHVPPIDYVTTGQPYYDPVTRVLTLSPNTYNITVSYNDGPVKREDSYERSLGEVDILVTSHCGEGGCEADLGENQANCCRDCGCSDYGETYFCFTGSSPNGECVDNSSILMEIVGFEPDPLGCIIGYIGGPCTFISSVESSLHIINAPSDVDVVDSFFTVDEEEPESMDCKSGKTHGNYTCPIVPGDLSGSEGTENKTIGLNLQLDYTIGSALVLQNVTASRSVQITKKKSEALANCEKEIERLEEQMAKLDENKAGYEGYGALFMVLAAIFLAVFIYCIVCSCNIITGGICGGGGESSGGSGAETASTGEGASAGIDDPYLDTVGADTTGDPSLWETGIPEIDEPLPPDAPVGTPTPVSTLSGLTGQAVGGTVSAANCALSCTPILSAAMQAMMMGMNTQQYGQSTELQKSQIEAQLEQKRAMCSSKSFGELAKAQGGMLPLMVY